MKKKLKRQLAILLSAVVVWTAVGVWLPGGTYEVKAGEKQYIVGTVEGMVGAFTECQADSDNTYYVELGADITITDAEIETSDDSSPGPVFQTSSGTIEVNLAGHTIDASSVITSGTIFYNSGGSLTITDSVGTGKIISPANGVIVRSEGEPLIFPEEALRMRASVSAYRTPRRILPVVLL